MPRQARKLSESGYMHLIDRGIAKQVIFVDRDDYIFFLSLLKKYSIETDISVCCYCLMDNHYHLLVMDKNGTVSLFMQKLNGSYSQYFNKKYDRSGQLFQARFKSEAIESEDYLVTVFRYILDNPNKAKICPAADYEWSSFRLYGSETSFVNTDVFTELLGSFEEYAAYIAAKNDDLCMEFGDEKHTDEWAAAIIRKELGVENGMMIRNWDWPKRNAALKLLKSKGLKIRQIERLTGINRGVIQKAK